MLIDFFLSLSILTINYRICQHIIVKMIIIFELWKAILAEYYNILCHLCLFVSLKFFLCWTAELWVIINENHSVFQWSFSVFLRMLLSECFFQIQDIIIGFCQFDLLVMFEGTDMLNYESFYLNIVRVWYTTNVTVFIIWSWSREVLNH